MRPLARRLFTFCSAVSLLLCAATFVAWGLSHFREFEVSGGWANEEGPYGTQHGSWVAFVEQGRIGVSVLWESGWHLSRERPRTGFETFVGANDPAHHWSYLAFAHESAGETDEAGLSIAEGELRGFGVEYTWSDSDIPESDIPPQEAVWEPGMLSVYRVARVPCTLIGGALAVGPLAWARLWTVRNRAAQRLASSQCLRCGYDLRATPCRCPECGTTVAVAAVAATTAGPAAPSTFITGSRFR